MDYGDSALVYQPVEENFIQIRQYLDTDRYTDRLDTLFRWCHAEFTRLDAVFKQRKHDGFVREWNPVIMSPEKHIGYAVQWFSMTFVLILLFLKEFMGGRNIKICFDIFRGFWCI